MNWGPFFLCLPTQSWVRTIHGSGVEDLQPSGKEHSLPCGVGRRTSMHKMNAHCTSWTWEGATNLQFDLLRLYMFLSCSCLSSLPRFRLSSTRVVYTTQYNGRVPTWSPRDKSPQSGGVYRQTVCTYLHFLLDPEISPRSTANCICERVCKPAV